MKYKDYIHINEDTLNSAEIISTALDNVGLGLAIVRQTKTKDNDETSNYKIDGHTVEAFLCYDASLTDDGFSEKDANTKITSLVDAFEGLGGKVESIGSINKDSIINFENFTIRISPLKINSSVDNSGFDRIYAVIKTE